MQRTLLAATLAVGWAFAVSPVAAGSRNGRATPSHYVVRQLSIPKRALAGVAQGINEHGLVVGNSIFESREQAEFWRLNAAGVELRREDVAPPKGYSSAYLRAVSNSGVAVGTVSTAVDASGTEAGYPAVYNGTSWTTLSRGSHPARGDAVAIAGNGVVGVVAWNPTLGQYAAAVATPSARGVYGRYQFLPLARRARDSDLASVFSVGATTVVGGYEDLPAPDGQVTGLPVIWINGKGPYSINTAALQANQPNFGVTSVYGRAPGKLYAVGFSLEDVNGVTATEGFIVSIDASGRKPVIGTPEAVPVPGDLTFASVTSIGGGPAGSSGVLTMGGDLSDWAGGTSAALWTARTAPRTASFTSVVILSVDAKATNPACPSYEVEGMNGAGNGAGFEYCDGETSPMVVYASAGKTG